VKILKFSAQNIKGIKVVDITPNGDVVTLSGKNGAGKSTVLNAIQNTLTGGNLPVRNGTEKGTVTINLGDYTVSRIITPKTDRLVIKNKDGATYPSPREFLSKFIGEMSIDPLAFIRLKERDQLDVLFKMNPGLEKKLAEFDKKKEEIKAYRSIILSEGKKLKVDIERAPHHDDAPEKEIETLFVVDELEEAKSNNDNLYSLQKEVVAIGEYCNDLQQDIQTCERTIKENKEAIVKFQKRLSSSDADLGEKRKKLAEMPLIEISRIKKRIESVDGQNKKVRENKAREEMEIKKAKASVKYGELGENMNEVDREKASLLAKTNAPIDELYVIDGGLTYRNVPISQLSTSEQVRVGASIAIAQNPKAKIILADDVSLLDKDNIKILHEICKGFQLWQVVNDDSGDIGFCIEEGEIKTSRKKQELATV